MKLPIARCCLATAVAFVAGTSSAATTETWDLTVGDTSSPYVNAWNYTNANSKTLSVRAFYADNLANVSGSIGDTVRNTTLQNNTKAATLKSQNGSGTVAGLGSFGGSGLGISNPYDGPSSNGQENSTGGQHAVDNYDWNGTTGTVDTNASYKHAHDFLLMDFNEVMELGSFRVGWKAYNNTGIDFFVAPDTLTADYDITGKNISTLIAAGWKQVSYDNVADCVPGNSSCPTQFSDGTGSTLGMKSRYIIAAGALGGNDDAFKFAQISMSSSSGGSTPIPGTAALLLVGLAGLAAVRRQANPS